MVDSEDFDVLFFFLTGVVFFRGRCGVGVGVGGGPVKNFLTFCPKDSSGVPLAGPVNAMVIIAIKIHNRLTFIRAGFISANFEGALFIVYFACQQKVEPVSGFRRNEHKPEGRTTLKPNANREYDRSRQRLG